MILRIVEILVSFTGLYAGIGVLVAGFLNFFRPNRIAPAITESGSGRARHACAARCIPGGIPASFLVEKMG